ncbi:hypothetical protein F4818DRAFT_419925 [Hypoxylon cercidicola]|nr:hypothetical protein F4818DRAFT_419925 [Hypoxylon cercidicola]
MPKRKRTGSTQNLSTVSTHDNTVVDDLGGEGTESIPSLPPPTDRETYLEYARTRAYLPLARWSDINGDPNQPIIGPIFTQRSSENHPVADLETYIKTVHWKQGSSFPIPPIFNPGVGHFRPQLEKGRMNRIILFAGCFNPPHRGHQELLDRAFSCTRDINVIAAFVFPISDRGVRKKEYADDIWFTRAERVRLWTGNQGPHDWLWVYNRSSDEWRTFLERLTGAVQRDGFQLEYVRLFGPDHVRINSVPGPLLAVENIIVGNVGRAADFVGEDGRLTRLMTCGAWQPVSIEQNEMVRMSTGMAEWIQISQLFTMSGEGGCIPQQRLSSMA